MKSLFFQPCRPFQIFRIIGMLTPIDFNDQFFFKANKINHIAAQRLLSPKLKPV